MRASWALRFVQLALCCLLTMPLYAQQPAEPATQHSIQPEQIRHQTEQIRHNLTTILARRDFKRVTEPNLVQRAEMEAWNWILERLSGVAGYGSKNPWFGRALETLGIVVPCTLLLWWVMQQSRRSRLLAEPTAPIELTAPSARDWQRWMEGADQFAREGRWREAVHHVYWAAISRIEAKGLWPADRTRTPREYLALLREDHALSSDLRQLTRSFERIWYGHRQAGEKQYRDVRALMERLAAR